MIRSSGAAGERGNPSRMLRRPTCLSSAIDGRWSAPKRRPVPRQRRCRRVLMSACTFSIDEANERGKSPLRPR